MTLKGWRVPRFVSRARQRVEDWFSAHQVTGGWLKIVRLGLFQFGLGLTLAPITGTLNRVLIDNMHIPALAVGFLIAIHYFVSPVRALVGFRSDQQRAGGGWRTPYLVLGGLLTFGGLANVPISLLLLSGDGSLSFWPSLVICTFIFLAYGLGVNIIETAYLALVSDLTLPSERGRVLAVLWIMLVLGTVVSSLALGSLLINYSTLRFIEVLKFSSLAFLILTVVSLWKQERLRGDGRVVEVHNQPRVRLSLRASLKKLAQQPVLRGLFGVLFIATLAFATHDVLLEPYGGQVLGMSIAATTRLTALWGVAMLASIGLTGWLLWRGASPVAPILGGCALGALGFLAITLARDATLVGLFYAGVALIGLGRGMFIVGSVALVMGLSDGGHAGLFLGLWGVMQSLAQGFGTVGGGLARDLALQRTGSVLLGYTSVYVAACLCLVLALALFQILNLQRRIRAGDARAPWSGLQDIPADQII
jgi:BCD family chlorophyll transporter-like MFS transporter